MESQPWEARAAAKRADTINKIYPQWKLSAQDIQRASEQRNLTGSFIQGFLSRQEIPILSMDSVPIVNAIKQGQLTSVQVTTAFCKAAAVAHQINNCLHEIFFDQALERAKELDEYYRKHGTTMGPLHGLPVSLKDQVHVKGIDTTTGYVGWIGSNMGIKDPSQAHKIESQIARELLSLGAVLYCKTSAPQTLFYVETNNHIIGQTLNPNNRNLSCGGSSGGEGALLALRGSTIGVGTDIGGSIRIPAAFNGVFAIKPTPGRLSSRDLAETNPGQTTYRATTGFLSTSLDAIELVLKSVLSTQPWIRDPVVVPMPFRQKIFDAHLGRAQSDGTANTSRPPLKLGILWTDGVVQPHPPISRGLRMVAGALEKAGHKVVNWDPPSHATAKNIHVSNTPFQAHPHASGLPSTFRAEPDADFESQKLSIIMADGTADVHKHLERSGEPLIPELASRGMRLRPPMDLLDFQDATLQGLDFETKYSDYWNATGDQDGQVVDAFIMPAAPHAAVIPGNFNHIAYTEGLNLLNYSVAVIPVTKADKHLDPIDRSYKPRGKSDSSNWEAYDPEIYHGAPVGLQIVARKFEEEKVLAIAKIVHRALKNAESGQPVGANHRGAEIHNRL